MAMYIKPMVPFTIPDILKPRHIKPKTNINKTHHTLDKEYRAVNYDTDKNAFLIIRLCFFVFV